MISCNVFNFFQLIIQAYPVIVSFTLISGIKSRRKRDCDTKNMRSKIENSLPSRYAQNVFCAKNPNQKETTCPGDSGKNLQLICSMSLASEIYFESGTLL